MKEIILVVEDDKAICKMLDFSLTSQGYRVLIAENLKSALRFFKTEKPDIILLDLGLPDGDGKKFIETVRNELLTPIIILSARNDEKEIIGSLDAGADDYMTKPFSVSELLARIRCAQRRSLGITPTRSTVVCGELLLDLQSHTVMKHDTLLKLTPTEFHLLQFCMLHPNQVLTHARVLKEVWGVGYQHEMQYLRTFINSLRKKIETHPARPQYIVTEMGIGYRFQCQDDTQIKD